MYYHVGGTGRTATATAVWRTRGAGNLWIRFTSALAMVQQNVPKTSLVELPSPGVNGNAETVTEFCAFHPTTTLE